MGAGLFDSIMLHRTFGQASCLLARKLNSEKLVQQVRNTYIMKRILNKEDADETITVTREDYQYDKVDHLSSQQWGNMEVILAQDVEGIGQKGDRVSVKKGLGRHKLILSGLAVYASPDNIAYYEKLKQELPPKSQQSIWARKTVRALNTMNLPVPMNPNQSWTLNKKHLRVAFRVAGVELKEDCLILPSEPITEPGEYKIQVVVNKVDKAEVNAIVYHYSETLKEVMDFPPLLSKSRVPLQFPDKLPGQ